MRRQPCGIGGCFRPSAKSFNKGRSTRALFNPWEIGLVVAALALGCTILGTAVGHCQEQRSEELLRNPGFDEDNDGDGLPDGWSVDRERIRWREKVFQGKDYVLISTPGQYVLATQEVRLKPGQKYTITLVMKGEEGALGGALIVHGEDQPRTEMPLLWNVQPTDEYEEYVGTFVAPNPVARLYIYNIARKGTIYYDRVSLREGEPGFAIIGQLSLREIDRPLGPPAETPHFDWASPLPGGPVKALVTIRNFRELRDSIELAQRMDLDQDVVHTGYEGNECVSETGRRAMQRLKAGEYEIYVVASRLPEALAKNIRERVEEGAGLVVLEGFGRSSSFVKTEELTATGDDHPLRAGVPWSLMPESILASIDVGTVGKGKVVRLLFPLDVSRVWGLVPTENNKAAYKTRQFEYWEWWYSLLVRSILWAAGRPTRGTLTLSPGQSTPETLVLKIEGSPTDVRARVVLRSGREIRFDRPPLRTQPRELAIGPDGTVQVDVPRDFPAGKVFADVALLDAQGHVVNSGSFALERPQSARLTALVADKEEYAPGDDTVGLTVQVAAAPGVAVAVQAQLIDAFGRLTAEVRKELPAVDGEQRVTIGLPVRAPLCVHHKAFVRLLVGGHEQDSGWVAVQVPKVGRHLVEEDFVVTSWAPGGSHYPILGFYADRVRELGLNAEFATDPYLVGEHGMLAAGYMSPPSGTFRLEKHSGTGIRPKCLSDPAVVEEYKAAARKAATEQRPYGVYAVGITDEAFLTSRHKRDEVCFSDFCQTRYREWLKNVYGTIEALNAEWGTVYTAWDEVRGARTEDVRGKENFAAFVDFRTFMTDVWVDACKTITDAYHEVAPEVPTGHTNTFGADPFNGNDYWKLCTQVGFGWGQEYSEAIKASGHKAIFDLWRSFVETPQSRAARAGGDPEAARVFFNHGWIGYDHRVEAAHYEPWWLALHGSRGLSYYATNAMDPGRGISWALVYPTLSFTPFSLAVKESLADLRAGCGKLFMDYEREKPQVALLWSHPSMLVSWCESSWDEPEPDERPGTDSYGSYFRSALNFRQHLNELQLDYIYLAPEQVTGADLARKYPLLYLPFTVAASPDLVDRLVAYVEAGGVLLGDLRCLRTDEHGKPWGEPSALRRLFGVERVGEVVNYGKTKVAFTALAEGLGLSGHEIELYGREALQTVGATALAQHATGEPALLVQKRTSGATIYLNFLLPEYDLVTRKLVRQITALAGVRRDVYAENPAGDRPPRCYERNTFRRGDITVHAFIRDHRRCADTDPVRFVLGQSAEVYDMREGRYVGKTDRVEATVAPGDTSVYACLPYRVTDLRVTVPGRLGMGEDLVITAQVVSDAGVPGDHVLHVELVNPRGEPEWHYTQNVLTSAGKARIRTPLALNEAQGQWTVRVRDILTGETGQARFQVTRR